MQRSAMEFLHSLAVAVLLIVRPSIGVVLAPFDADSECVTGQQDNSSRTLLDSQHYLSLQRLWFADDESLDPFDFPVPEDPVRWELVDQTPCRNVWQYCGDSAADILFTQLVTRGGGVVVIISVEYSFSSGGSSGDNTDPCIAAGDDVLIVEADDTTGPGNIHTEVIPRCVGNQSTTAYSFLYEPMDNFELVFRSSNISDSTCVNISRVLAFQCSSGYFPSNTSDISCISCPDRQYYAAELNVCLSCPSRSHSTNGGPCMCDTGYERSNPSNTSLPCDMCADGFTMDRNGSCSDCPLPGHDINLDRDMCQCYNMRRRRSLVSSNLTTCVFCAANYRRNTSTDDCVLCPVGSRRELVFADDSDEDGVPLVDMEGICTCTEGSLTGAGEATTSGVPCDNCDDLHFWNGINCIPCPSRSMRAVADSTHCVCEAGTLTLSGQNMTTSDGCMCMNDSYYSPDGMACQICPANSFRVSSSDSDDAICPCLEGFRRPSSDITSMQASLPCLRYAGFSVNTVALSEGDDDDDEEMTSVLSLLMSQVGSSDAEVVTIRVVVVNSAQDVSRSGVAVSLNPRDITFLGNVTRQDFQLAHMGNTVALDGNTTVSLSLENITGEVLFGGAELFERVNITFVDDDYLDVGFTEDRFLFNAATDESGLVRVNISSRIAMTVVMLVRANASLSPDHPASDIYEVIFTPGDNTLSNVLTFDLQQDTSSTRYVLLSLEVATYPPSLNAVRHRIRVGQLSGLYQEAVVVMEGSGGPTFTSSALIGIVSSMVALSMFALAVLIALFLCYKPGRKNKPRKKSLQLSHKDLVLEEREANNIDSKLEEGITEIIT